MIHINICFPYPEKDENGQPKPNFWIYPEATEQQLEPLDRAFQYQLRKQDEVANPWDLDWKSDAQIIDFQNRYRCEASTMRDTELSAKGQSLKEKKKKFLLERRYFESPHYVNEEVFMNADSLFSKIMNVDDWDVYTLEKVKFRENVARWRAMMFLREIGCMSWSTEHRYKKLAKQFDNIYDRYMQKQELNLNPVLSRVQKQQILQLDRMNFRLYRMAQYRKNRLNDTTRDLFEKGFTNAHAVRSDIKILGFCANQLRWDDENTIAYKLNHIE